MTLKEAFDSRQDNFLFMRMFAATMVIYGHSYAISNPNRISGADVFQRYIGGTYSGTIAVQIFFVISGFLITASYLNRHDIFFFIKSRVLRIFPALIVAVVLSALIVGPIFTDRSLASYFEDSQVYKYIITNISLISNEWFLPGVFEDHPKKSVNGSLWTLPAEGRMYLMVAIFGLLGILKNRSLFNVVAFVLLFIGIFYPSLLIMVGHQSHFKVVPFFLAGAFFFVNRDSISLDANTLLVLISLCFITHGTQAFKISFGIFLAYFTIWMCYVPNLRTFNKIGDYSYGLYVYAFPIQQIIRQFTGPIHPLELFMYSFTVILLVSYFSWNYIEQPMLRLKNTNFRSLIWLRSGV